MNGENKNPGKRRSKEMGENETPLSFEIWDHITLLYLKVIVYYLTLLQIPLVF